MLFNNIMDLADLIARYATKLFYISIIFVKFDAIRYQTKYYKDNDFDNSLIGKNLKNLWRTQETYPNEEVGTEKGLPAADFN